MGILNSIGCNAQPAPAAGTWTLISPVPEVGNVAFTSVQAQMWWAHPGQWGAGSDVWQGCGVGCLGCGVGSPGGTLMQAAHITCSVSAGIHSPRADAELLGPTKIMGCEAAKQTLEIYKQVLIHLRVPCLSLQASWGHLGTRVKLGIQKQHHTAPCFVRINTIFHLLLQPIQSYTVLEVAFLHKPRDLQSSSSYSLPDVYYLITYICFTMMLELILSSTTTETCLVPPVCADINNNLSKHLPYKCWGKGQGHMFQMEIQPGVVPLVALSYVILSQCNMRGSDSSTPCMVFGCLLTYFFMNVGGLVIGMMTKLQQSSSDPSIS